MAQLNLHSNKKTELNNRVLYFDGDSIVDKEFIYDFLLSNNNISDHNLFLENIDGEVTEYNTQFDCDITSKTSIGGNDYSWNIPKKYTTLNIEDYIDKLLHVEISKNHFSKTNINTRLDRTLCELKKWKERNMYKLLRTLIYIVDTFKEKNIVWGTGRGSSCCCYILYLIELHDVDSVLYDLDLKEFFR